MLTKSRNNKEKEIRDILGVVVGWLKNKKIAAVDLSI